MQQLGQWFQGINRAADPNHLTDVEKQHLPLISAPDTVKAGECFDVRIRVGDGMALMQARDHFIDFVALYAGNVYLARADYAPILTCPETVFRIRLPSPLGPLRAFAYCNTHGTWESQRPVTVA